jgi:hypothetical protein
MQKFLQKAERFSEDGFPEESLNNMRKFTEVAVKDLGEKFECLAEGKHWFNSTTQKLQKHLPARLFYYIQHVQSMGNYGSHFQEDGVEPSKEDTEYCVYAGMEIFRWMYPVVGNIAEVPDFIQEAYKAVDCPACGSKKGERCKPLLEYKKEEWEGKHDNVHEKRNSQYSNYRREFQKQYNTTIADAMHKMVSDLNWKKGELFEPKVIRNWFLDNFPAYTKNAVNSHAMMMATNLKTRQSHPESKNGDEKFNLFYAEKRKFRLYELDNDPEPLLFGKDNS